MSQYNYEVQDQYAETSGDWQQQPGQNETNGDSRFLNRLKDGQDPEVVRIDC
jgi:hypothetical protein